MKDSVVNSIIGICFCASLAAAMPVAAASDNDWEFGASIYGWFPDIGGQTRISEAGGGSDFEIEIGDILKNLEFTLQGGFDARRGRWGVATDLIYMSIGNSESQTAEGSVGGTPIPVDVRAEIDFDMKSWIWTTAGYYRVQASAASSVDLLAGVRYIDVEQKVDWTLSGNVGGIPLPDRQGEAKGGLSNWDFIVGLRGRATFGDNNAWYIPYYADVGTGDSDLTYQLMAGLGYAFGWGDINAVWRYLSYELESGSAIKDMNFNGPALGATFRW